jgi:hypothetical protein
MQPFIMGDIFTFYRGLGQLLAGQLLAGQMRADGCSPDRCSLGQLLARTVARAYRNKYMNEKYEDIL